MWPKGYEIRWSRRTLPRKEGPAPPTRPGFGQTKLKVLRDREGYYVGTGFILPNNSEIPYTIESDYFDTEKEAKNILSKMTGGNILENILREYITTFLSHQHIKNKR